MGAFAIFLVGGGADLLVSISVHIKFAMPSLNHDEYFLVIFFKAHLFVNIGSLKYSGIN